jgi:hypothetical protein
MTKNFFFHPSLLLLFLDPGSGMGKNPDPGSGINIPDPQHCFFFNFVRFVATKKGRLTNLPPPPSLVAVVGSGDPRSGIDKNPVSGINI